MVGCLLYRSRFQPVTVPEPSIDETYEILQGLRERYETHHKLRYTGACGYGHHALATVVSCIWHDCMILCDLGFRRSAWCSFVVHYCCGMFRWFHLSSNVGSLSQQSNAAASTSLH
jgi:hypothetical protein